MFSGRIITWVVDNLSHGRFLGLNSPSRSNTGSHMSEGKKFDTDKPQSDLIDPEALEDLAKVLTIGAQKYDRYNWKNVEPHRYEAALFRHFQSWRMGEYRDPESGLHHMAHVLANAMFLYCLDRIKEDLEDLE